MKKCFCTVIWQVRVGCVEMLNCFISNTSSMNMCWMQEQSYQNCRLKYRICLKLVTIIIFDNLNPWWMVWWTIVLQNIWCQHDSDHDGRMSLYSSFYDFIIQFGNFRGYVISFSSKNPLDNSILSFSMTVRTKYSNQHI